MSCTCACTCALWAEYAPSRPEALRRAEVDLIDGPGYVDPRAGKTLFSYAHPIFWAPFALSGP